MCSFSIETFARNSEIRLKVQAKLKKIFLFWLLYGMATLLFGKVSRLTDRYHFLAESLNDRFVVHNC